MDSAVVQIGTTLIALFGAIITYIVVPYVKSKTTEQQQSNIVFWIKTAVNAAEQVFADSGMGTQKKEYVMEFIQNMGISLTEDELDALIEAAVLEINKNLK